MLNNRDDQRLQHLKSIGEESGGDPWALHLSSVGWLAELSERMCGEVYTRNSEIVDLYGQFREVVQGESTPEGLAEGLAKMLMVWFEERGLELDSDADPLKTLNDKSALRARGY